MRVVVTGGTGFAGAALSLRLAAEGHEVLALARREGPRSAELRAAGVEIALGSVTDPAALDTHLPEAHVVFHLAAAFRDTSLPPRHYREVNVGGTRLVAERALRHGVRRLVHCSTCAVHGCIAAPPADEHAPIRPRGHVHASKYDGELALAPFPERGLPVTILRPAGIYGPGDPARFALVFRRVAEGRFPMFGDGRTLFHPLYVDNLVEAFLAAAARAPGEGEAYLIADAAWVTLDDLVHAAAGTLGVAVRVVHLPLAPLELAALLGDCFLRPLGIPWPISSGRVDWFRCDRAFRIDRARRELGWEPRVDLAEGLRRTAAWCLANGYLHG